MPETNGIVQRDAGRYRPPDITTSQKWVVSTLGYQPAGTTVVTRF